MLPGLNLDTFINKMKATGGFARSYLFYITPTIPNYADVNTTYFVKSSTLPSSNFEEISNSMQSIDFKSAGKRNFDTWSVSFYIDGQAKIRQAFTEWLRMIYDPATGIHGYPSEYVRDQKVSLIGTNRNEILTYTLYKAWPSVVGESPLDYSTTDYSQFDVTFTYQYYVASNQAVNQAAKKIGVPKGM
jgi:hypothetical protein